MNSLDKICAVKRREVDRRKQVRSAVELKRIAGDQSAPRGFIASLERRVTAGSFGLIAEIKKASPSKGLIRDNFEPQAHAKSYEEGGAACLSVLTEENFFLGRDADLVSARGACSLPCLRKDFMIDPWQVTEARAIGADAILIIVAAIDDQDMADLEAAAIDHGLDVLVEVHDVDELERALRLRSRLIGVNSRDLRNFSINFEPALEIISQIPSGYTVVAESGLRSRRDLELLAEHGVNCFLVGESLMRQPDLEAATRNLLSAN
jgi:indole-3-glycerol phosphate synthase